MKNLAEQFKAVIESKPGRSMSDVARSAKVDRTTVWKVLHSRPVRAETFRRLLTAGLGLRPNSREFAELVGQWALEAGVKTNGFAAAYTKARSAEEEALHDVLRAVPRSELPTVVRAISDPGIRKMLPELLRLRGIK